MPDEAMGPDRLVLKGLPRARRGYDHDAVEVLLRQARTAWATLEEEHRRLLAEIEHAGGLDFLSRDLGAVGSDIGRVLAGAQEAARGLRERARADSAERLSAAAAEAQRLVSEAEGQAFHLRADAWAAAEGLLRQAEEAHRRMLAAADAEVLMIRADAEQEAYRLVATARREAQEITRGARFEAERTVLEIKAQPERILPVEPVPVEPAAPPAEPATGRARRRRGPSEPTAAHEDVVRVIQPPGSRRPTGEGLDPGSYGDVLAAEVEALRVSGEVPVVHREAGTAPVAAPSSPLRHEPPAPALVAAPPEVVADEAVHSGAGTVGREEVAPVEAPREAVGVVEEIGAGTEADEGAEEPASGEPPRETSVFAEAPPAGPEALTAEPVSSEVAVGASEDGVVAPAAAPAPPVVARPRSSVVDDLFARLRGVAPPSPAIGESPANTAPAHDRPEAPREVVAGPDPLEVRDRLLLPVQNRALRRVKEALVELQNQALDALRVSGAWAGEEITASALTEALDAVGEEGAEAGAAAVAALHGGAAPAPVISSRGTALARSMAGELSAQVGAVVTGFTDAGPLEVAAGVARVFRAWRSEEAERWVRAVAYAGYHDSLLAGLAVAGVAAVKPVPSGLLCPECPALAGANWDPAGRPPRALARPPAHPGCVCTVAPA
jgi:cell division septum initiation protein DivIVA